MADTFAIVGAGLAGARAAETLRAEGFDGRVVLFGAEAHLPYERPALSKGYLQGAAEAPFVHPAEWYAEQDVDLRLGTRVTALDPAAHEVETADGDRLRYTKLLLTTGSSVRRLADAVTLRTLDDSDRLRAALRPGARVAIVGAGWIGLEVAAAARIAGAEVTVLEQAPAPLLAALGPEMAAVFARLHVEHGVDLRCGVTVRAVKSDAVLLDDETVPADLVVAGIGVTPGRRPRAGRRARGRQRHRRRRAPAQLRPRRLGGGRRRQRLPPVRGQARARGALGQRAAPAGRRGAGDAREGRRLRPAAVLLHRPVRPRHGVHRVRRRRGGGARRRAASSSRSGCGTVGSRRR